MDPCLWYLITSAIDPILCAHQGVALFFCLLDHFSRSVVGTKWVLRVCSQRGPTASPSLDSTLPSLGGCHIDCTSRPAGRQHVEHLERTRQRLAQGFALARAINRAQLASPFERSGKRGEEEGAEWERRTSGEGIAGPG